MITRAEAREIVKHPGKFEGEPPITPILYEIALEGCNDEDYSQEGLGWWARIGRYIIYENDYGFVYSTRYASADAAIAEIDSLIAEFEEDQDSDNY